jgi:N-acyl-D-amino-acid deacylase
VSVDLLLRGGLVADGTTAPLRRADVGVRDGRIVLVEDLGDREVDAGDVIDATGRVVAPGFIDIHTHSDVVLLAEPGGASKILQGVTTDVIGNCSFSPFPVAPQRRAELADHLARLGDGAPDPTWTDLEGYARALDEARPALNVAPLVGHGALRIAAMQDPYGPADRADVDRMQELLAEALDQGAWGMSTGLTHTPSSLGPSAEVEDLCRVVASRDALYATHARAVAGGELDAIREAITAARTTGVRLEYSHLALNEPANWGRATDALALFEAAVADGIDAAFDVYPYDASSSSLVQYLPEWVQAGGTEALRRNRTDRSWCQRALADLRLGWFGGIPWLWDRFVLTAVPGRSDLVGLTLEQASVATGTEPDVLVLELCTTIGSDVQVVLFYRTEEDMTAFLSHPLAAVGSDGNALPIDHGSGQPHPRSFGTYPRILGRYVRDQARLTLPEAVARMTSVPADRLGLGDRGRVVTGGIADLVVIDPGSVADTSTFENPRSAPIGISCTIVAGIPVSREGRLTGARPGRVLRRG